MTNPLRIFGEIRNDVVVNLLDGTVTPSRKGDDVENYYKNMSKWFRDVLVKEDIPLEVIEKAIIVITSGGKQTCTIIAKGKAFKSGR
jgi:hypothetical protein